MPIVSDWFAQLSAPLQALGGTTFTYGMTAAGALMILFLKGINRKVMDGMLGFAAGVMIAASFWSLLAPAIALSETGPLPSWMPATLGFLLGGAFLRGVDLVLPHLHPGLQMNQAEGIKTHWRKTILLVLAITLHNIPEGLAVVVAFGAVAAGIPEATLAGAIALAIGIGIQNFPEGAAVAFPLRRENISRGTAFFYGQLSGIVEPIAGLLGAAAVIVARPLLPWALAFAAGAMIFVVAEEVIPEAQAEGNNHIATFGVMVGFAAMMMLDVALG
ncbi:MAG: ZIP family metal transporter [Anaerolineae bacterium]